MQNIGNRNNNKKWREKNNENPQRYAKNKCDWQTYRYMQTIVLEDLGITQKNQYLSYAYNGGSEDNSTTVFARGCMRRCIK